MRTLRLVSIAASAEGLRLRRVVRRLSVQAALGAVAAVFFVLALAVGHGVGYIALREVPLSPLYAGLIVLGVDVFLALVFGILASRSSTDRIEQEAILVSAQARQQLSIAAASAGAFAPIARLLGIKQVSRLIIGALTARYLAQGEQHAPASPPASRRH